METPPREVRVGIVGFGFIGKVHAWAHCNLPFYYDLPVRTRITHVCTAHAETAAAAAALVGAAEPVTDFRRITEAADVDVVHICTPNHLHKDALLSAMAHGKDIYCDKPLVADTDEAAEIRDALDGYEGIAQMTLQNRFYPATMRARQLIADDFLGDVHEFRAAYLHSGSADPAAPLKWKLRGSAGGGVIADLGTHVMDLVHFLLGDYAAVSAATRIAYAERPDPDDPNATLEVDAEDQMVVLARLTSGALGTVAATKTATGTEDEMRVEIHGSKGALRFNGMDPHHLEAYDAGAAAKPIGGIRGWTAIDTGQRFPAPANGFPGPKFAPGWLRCHLACLANFIEAIGERRSPEPGLDQGIYLQHLIGAVRESAANGAWINV